MMRISREINEEAEFGLVKQGFGPAGMDTDTIHGRSPDSIFYKNCLCICLRKFRIFETFLKNETKFSNKSWFVSRKPGFARLRRAKYDKNI